MICRKCGKENADETKFCSECGTSLISKNCECAEENNVGNIEKTKIDEENNREIDLNRKKKRKKIILIIIAVIIVLGFYNLVKCDHNYLAATCDAPMTCQFCGKQKGSVLEHKWDEATCRAPKTCSLCDKTVGEALEHIPGKIETETDLISAEKIEKQHCEVCYKLLDEKVTPLKKLHNGERFIFTPYQFSNRLEDKLEDIPGNTFRTVTGSLNGSLACGILEGDSKSGAIMFLDGEKKLNLNNGNNDGFTALIGSVYGVEAIGSVIVALFTTCDPTISDYEALTLAEKLLDKGEITKNGIVYVFTISGNNANIGVALD